MLKNTKKKLSLSNSVLIFSYFNKFEIFLFIIVIVALQGKNQKNRKSILDIGPSDNGRRVEPKISEELIKRIQAAEKAKIKKEVKKEYDPVRCMFYDLFDVYSIRIYDGYRYRQRIGNNAIFVFVFFFVLGTNL